jgi:hypothetical protein
VRVHVCICTILFRPDQQMGLSVTMSVFHMCVCVCPCVYVQYSKQRGVTRAARTSQVGVILFLRTYLHPHTHTHTRAWETRVQPRHHGWGSHSLIIRIMHTHPHTHTYTHTHTHTRTHTHQGLGDACSQGVAGGVAVPPRNRRLQDGACVPRS